MSIRIYALAKQLNVDSKIVLDVIKAVGIEGKGTTLSSLTPEEVTLVRGKLNARKQTKPAGEPAFVRPSVPTDTKIRVITPKQTATPATEPQSTVEPTGIVTENKPVTEHVTVEKPQVETAPVAEVKPDKPTIQVKPPTAEKPPAKPVITKVTGPVKVIPPKKPKPVEPEVPEKPAEPVAETSEPKYKLPPALGKMEISPGTKGGWAGKRELKKQQEQKKKGGDGHQQDDRQHKSPRPPVHQKKEPVTTGYSQQGYAANVGRKDHVGPMRRIADKVSNREPGRDGGERQRPAPGGGGLMLASVPQQTQLKQRKSNEPAPMKPDAKLPVELLKSDNAAELVKAHIRNHAEKQKRKEIERKGLEVRGKVSNVRDKRSIDADVNAVFEANKKKRLKSNRRHQHDTDEDGVYTPRSLQRRRSRGKSIVNTAAPRKSDLVIQMPCNIREFAETTGLPTVAVLRKLLEMGTIANINSILERDSAELLASAFDLQATIRDEVTLENQLVASAEDDTDPPEKLKPRPPVVTVLGHVDHGKTTLLDNILHLNVVSGEKGGITQHIRAYRVKMPNGQDITFVDTPGHEAFTEMRARGANCTDIVILVVAADDGVMPQTEEAISHAKAAGVPIVVALNKMDLPGVNEDRIIQELAQHELMPSEWGGDTEIIRCSALTGMGIDKLLETVQLIAEMHELKANPERKAAGMTLESELQSGQGVVAKVLVQNGTLRTGDVVLCGASYGRVRVMYDTLDTNKVIDEATPSTPVNLIGLDAAPQAGSRFVVLDDISDARRIAEERLKAEHEDELTEIRSHVTLENLFQRMTHGKSVQTLNIIIRADVRGSIEAIRKELGKLEHPEVKIKILQATVGGITEGDVQLAAASDAIIVGFTVVPDENARSLADAKKVQIRRYDIIYNLTDDIKKALEGMLRPIEQVKELGRALVQRIFVVSRVGTIAGCRVTSGTIERDSKIRIIRDSRIIGEYPLDSLKREKDDVKEIREGYECGIKLKGYNDIKDGDLLEAFKIEEVARTF
ncbi:translation initiation factor IF-2 [Planctomycetales bacterium]|nr:translation initiation factor IF-2 [Planctomycetales bacterium]